jgi:hypothetical protein
MVSTNRIVSTRGDGLSAFSRHISGLAIVVPVHSEDLALDLALDLRERKSVMDTYSSIQHESNLNKRMLAL